MGKLGLKELGFMSGQMVAPSSGGIIWLPRPGEEDCNDVDFSGLIAELNHATSELSHDSTDTGQLGSVSENGETEGASDAVKHYPPQPTQLEADEQAAAHKAGTAGPNGAPSSHSLSVKVDSPAGRTPPHTSPPHPQTFVSDSPTRVGDGASQTVLFTAPNTIGQGASGKEGRPSIQSSGSAFREFKR